MEKKRSLPYKTLTIFNLLVPCLIIFGGTVFKFGTANIEVAAVGPWFLLLLLLNYAYSKIFNEDSPLKVALNSLITRRYSKKSFYILLTIVCYLLFGAHLLKYLSLHVHGLDQAFVHQSLFYSFDSPLLRCDVCSNGTYFGEHISFTLLLLGSVFQFIHSNVLVYFVEALILFAAMVLIFKCFLTEKTKLWTLILFIILCHQGIRYSFIWDFREDHLTFLFLTIFLICLFKRKFLFATASFLAVLWSKEHLVYFLPFLAIPIWLERELPLNKKERVIIMSSVVISSIVWMFSLKAFVVPYFNEGNPPTLHLVRRFPGFGSTNMEVLLNVLFSPKHWLKLLSERIFEFSSIKYIFYLMAPFAVLIYKKWWWIISALPLIALNLISYSDSQRSLSFHYDLAIYPALLIAFVLAAKNASKRQIYICLIFALLASGRWPAFYFYKYWPEYNQAKDVSYLSGMKTDFTYMTSLKTAAFLSHAKEIKILARCEGEGPRIKYVPAFKNQENSDFVILDLKDKCQRESLASFLQGDYQEIERSPSGRFLKLAKPTL